MLSRNEQMQPGFVDFQNFPQGSSFATKKPTKLDFARTVTKGWLEQLKSLTVLLIPFENLILHWIKVVKQCNKYLSKICQT